MIRRSNRLLSKILTTTRDYIEGTVVTKELGVVVGNSVLSRNVGLDVLSRMKSLVGGELYSYTELLEEAATEATRRAMNEAALINANGVLRLRYQTSALTDPFTGTFILVMASGTAVQLTDDPESSHNPVAQFMKEKDDPLQTIDVKSYSESTDTSDSSNSSSASKPTTSSNVV